MLRPLLRRAFSATAAATKSKKIESLTADEVRELFTKRGDIAISSQAFQLLAFKVSDEPLNTLKVSVVAGKKRLSKLAVIRSRATRRIKSAVQQVFCDNVPKNYKYLLFLNPPSVTSPWPQILKEVSYAAQCVSSKAKKRGHREQMQGDSVDPAKNRRERDMKSTKRRQEKHFPDFPSSHIS